MASCHGWRNGIGELMGWDEHERVPLSFCWLPLSGSRVSAAENDGWASMYYLPSTERFLHMTTISSNKLIAG